LCSTVYRDFVQVLCTGAVCSDSVQGLCTGTVLEYCVV
jgi:hypothetical protein